MTILLCHAYYQQPGGEDASFAEEAALLESRGHRVVRFTLDNRDVPPAPGWRTARDAVWNRAVHAELAAVLRSERVAVMHCTNLFPRISPAAYWAAHRAGVPVVQSLRNYRLFCVNGYLLREGRVCEDCVGRRVPWPGVLRACYRSRAASGAVAAMIGVHHLLGTWTQAVDRYFAPTRFARAKYVAAGFPADRIDVKPNFVHPDPGPGRGGGGYAVFAGRLEPEKGVRTLLAAWGQVDAGARLKVFGDGPLREEVRRAAAHDSRIEWLGHRPAAEVQAALGDATLLLTPSVCYETFGRTIVEAFARGTPVLASRHGAMAELVHDGVTGRLVAPADAADLARAIRQCLAEPATLAALRRGARRAFERRYTADHNYRQLMAIYRRGGAGAPARAA
jgi:glycosyltransferase involved in cell wall biosynthesis